MTTHSRPTTREFQRIILVHYAEHGRDLPWRHTRDPYAILVSEVMLQQTQTERVIPKYEQWLDRFPNISELAQASLADVLQLWQGLGYNRRAKALKDIAEMVMSRYGGAIPDSRDTLMAFPGIGHYTASAICTFAFDQPLIFIETNIRRVFIHFYFPNSVGGDGHERKVHDRELLPLVERTLNRKDPRTWYYALMDYGAMLKGKVENPNRRSAHYSRQSRFEGSDRQIRGIILRELLDVPELKEEQLIEVVVEIRSGKGRRASDKKGKDRERSVETRGNKRGGEAGEKVEAGKIVSTHEKERVRYILEQLEREGFVMEEKGIYRIHRT